MIWLEQASLPIQQIHKSKPSPKEAAKSQESEATSTPSNLTDNFTRLDTELEHINNMVISSNVTNTASLKTLEASLSSPHSTTPLN